MIVECVVHRALERDARSPRVAVECATLLGGFLIILSVALGLTNYLVIAEVPVRLLDWAQARITSPIVFLLALNVFLILVGRADGHLLGDRRRRAADPSVGASPTASIPVHLAVIFLANMELGYLMPPMGENLFLSSYRFNRPLTRIYRSTLPYTAIL